MKYGNFLPNKSPICTILTTLYLKNPGVQGPTQTQWPLLSEIPVSFSLFSGSFVRTIYFFHRSLDHCYLWQPQVSWLRFSMQKLRNSNATYLTQALRNENIFLLTHNTKNVSWKNVGFWLVGGGFFGGFSPPVLLQHFFPGAWRKIY